MMCPRCMNAPDGGLCDECRELASSWSTVVTQPKQPKHGVIWLEKTNGEGGLERVPVLANRKERRRAAAEARRRR